MFTKFTGDTRTIIITIKSIKAHETILLSIDHFRYSFILTQTSCICRYSLKGTVQYLFNNLFCKSIHPHFKGAVCMVIDCSAFAMNRKRVGVSRISSSEIIFTIHHPYLQHHLKLSRKMSLKERYEQSLWVGVEIFENNVQ